MFRQKAAFRGVYRTSAEKSKSVDHLFTYDNKYCPARKGNF